MSVHLARRCDCGRQGGGVAVSGVLYAVQDAPRVVGRIPTPEELRVYCAGCGATGPYTHVAVKVGGVVVRVVGAFGGKGAKTTKTRRTMK